MDEARYIRHRIPTFRINFILRSSPPHERALEGIKTLSGLYFRLLRPFYNLHRLTNEHLQDIGIAQFGLRQQLLLAVRAAATGVDLEQHIGLQVLP